MQWRFSCHFLKITYCSYTGGSFDIQTHLPISYLHFFRTEGCFEQEVELSLHQQTRNEKKHSGMKMVLLSRGMLFRSHIISMPKIMQILLLWPKHFI